MTDIIDDPAFVHDLMDFASEVAIAYATAQVDSRADTIGMSDAAGSMWGHGITATSCCRGNDESCNRSGPATQKSSFASTCAERFPARPQIATCRWIYNWTSPRTWPWREPDSAPNV